VRPPSPPQTELSVVVNHDDEVQSGDFRALTASVFRKPSEEGEPVVLACLCVEFSGGGVLLPLKLGWVVLLACWVDVAFDLVRS